MERDGEYEVEEIVDKRTLRRSSRLTGGQQVQYLVKWKGYDDGENTWEWEDMLTKCQEKIEEYERREAARGGGRRQLRRQEQ